MCRGDCMAFAPDALRDAFGRKGGTFADHAFAAGVEHSNTSDFP
ncbi:hypothetical protein BAN20980_04297 [Burkholderia anthina]|uniref:Uncharacterized protein n=1 Tax=Burkholderia anthina TaxID=179879 RepID=A0A6P2GD79_9BURK|nr:hypothetical protein BAN20980_04297 [Burkholderia anthina]